MPFKIKCGLCGRELQPGITQKDHLMRNHVEEIIEDYVLKCFSYCWK